MNVMLIPPVFHYKTEYPAPLSVSDFPSGFAYVAAALKEAGHQVIGCNLNNITGYVSAKFMLQETLQRKIRETKPDMMGLGGLCTDFAFLRDAIGIVRTTDPTIPIVLGGQIVTNDAKDICDILKPDFAIVGEAEEAVLKVITMVEAKQDYGNQPARQALAGGPIVIQQNNLKPIDGLSFPDYEPFGVQEMLDKHSAHTRLLYRYPRAYPRPFNIVASRSCPFTCTFCVHGHRDVPYRARSIENIMREIEVMYAKYQFNILIILDELFAVKNNRLKDFCEAVIKGKEKHNWDFDWMFQTHASARFDLDTLKLAKRAGCFFFSYGLESASPLVLESMNKKIKVEQVVEAMGMAREAGVGFGANLIFGDPAETAESWAESLRFWLKYGQENMMFLGNLMPYPGSAVFEACRSKAMFQDKREFYEHIDEGVPNITAIPMETFQGLLNITGSLEKSWLFVKEATDVKIEKEERTLHKIYALCPYCGYISVYREHILDQRPAMLGTGCQRCNRRVKVVLR